MLRSDDGSCASGRRRSPSPGSSAATPKAGNGRVSKKTKTKTPPKKKSKLRVIHLGTQIQAVFGLLNEEGNVVERKSTTLSADELTPEIFQQALIYILGEREKLKGGLKTGKAGENNADSD